jgi:hypothetical protein
MQIQVEPPQERVITITVTEAEARSVSIWLRDALRANINTPASSDKVRGLLQAFRQIAGE